MHVLLKFLVFFLYHRYLPDQNKYSAQTLRSHVVFREDTPSLKLCTFGVSPEMSCLFCMTWEVIAVSEVAKYIISSSAALT